MKRSPYGYGSYRGRGQGSTALKILAALLAVVLVLVVAGFFLLERYMVYGDDGEARLELPFLQREDKDDPEQGQPLPIVPAVTPEPTAEEPERPERPKVILPVFLGQEALYDGTAKEALTEGGGTAAVFDMKGTDGMLGWVSDEELAIAARVSAADPERNEAIKAAAAEDGVYRIARISCFKDNELSNADTSLAIMTESGYRWLDAESVRWVSPADGKVQDYLTALCRELAGLGFDEILLDNAGYPTKGKLQYIRKNDAYDAEQFESVIAGFYEKLARELEDSGVVLSVVYDPATTALSGQSEEVIRELGITMVTRDEDGTLKWSGQEPG